MPTMTEDQEIDNQGDSSSQKLTRRQKIIFCGIAASYVFNLMSFSIMAPFFPAEAAKKGLSPTEVGFIFALFNLVNFLASPLFGKYLPVLGAKFVFLAGAWVAAGCNVLFGVLDEIDDKETFMIYCFVVRAIEACGSAASITASMTITANTFPNNMAQMMGLLESFSGIGFMVGPPLGGLLYSFGGYKMPFFVLGGMSVATIIVNILLLPSVGVDQTESGSVKAVLMIPAFYPTALSVIVGSACLGFLDPTLSTHLLSFDISQPLVAVAFLLIGGVYAITSPLWGYLADKKKNTRFMMVIGFYISTICYLLLGPSPLLKLPNQLWIVIMALALSGLALGCALMPTFLDFFISVQYHKKDQVIQVHIMGLSFVCTILDWLKRTEALQNITIAPTYAYNAKESIRWYGFKDNLATQGVVSGLFNSLFSFGGFIGPLLGGYMVDKLNFSWASTCFAGANLFVMVVICLFGIWEFNWGKGRRPPWIWFGDASRNGETEPLLRNNEDSSAVPEKNINVQH